MSDAMVVARMSQEKKDSVSRTFAELGTNASRVINQLYDYVEATGTLPNMEIHPEDDRKTRYEIACNWLNGINRLPEGNRFQLLSDGEIRAERLEQRLSRWEAQR